AFLGPIFTVLIVDYFILKKQNLEIDELYNENGKFKGVNKYAGGIILFRIFVVTCAKAIKIRVIITSPLLSTADENTFIG
ncbi:Permease for cytosine/purine, uracil, thiamine, allantoin, partial [human gut metagenome]